MVVATLSQTCHPGRRCSTNRLMTSIASPISSLAARNALKRAATSGFPSIAFCTDCATGDVACAMAAQLANANKLNRRSVFFMMEIACLAGDCS